MLVFVIVSVGVTTAALPNSVGKTLDGIHCRITWEQWIVDNSSGDAINAVGRDDDDIDAATPDKVVLVYEGSSGFGPTTEPVDRDIASPPLELGESVVFDDPDNVREVRRRC